MKEDEEEELTLCIKKDTLKPVRISSNNNNNNKVPTV